MSTVSGASERSTGEVPSPDPSLLALVGSELEEAASIIIDDKIDERYAKSMQEQLVYGRRINRKTAQVLSDDHRDLSTTIAALLLEQPEQELPDRQAFVQDLLKPLAAVKSPTVNALPLSIFNQVDTIKQVDSLAAAVTSRISNEVEGRTSERYQLMRLLAVSHASLKGSPNPQDRAIQTLQDLSSLEAHRGKRHDLLADVTEGLEAGTFDSLLAEDMLAEAMAQPADHDSQDQDQEELAALVRFITPLTGEDTSAAVGWLSASENLANWPPAYRQIFEAYKTQQLKALADNHAANLQFLDKRGYTPPEKVSLETIERQIGELTMQLWQATANNPGGQPTLRAQARMTTLLHDTRLERQIARMGSHGPRRRRHSGDNEPTATAKAADPAASPEGSKKPRPRDIVYLTSTNEEAQAGSAAYKDLLDTYIRKHGGGPGLSADMDTLLNYLREVDLSQGGVPGVGVVGKRLRIGSRHISNLRMLEPYKAVGLSTSTSEANQVCVMFELLDNGQKIGLVDILHDSEVRAFGRSHGIKGLKRRRQANVRHS